jgi:hypothetical protein
MRTGIIIKSLKLIPVFFILLFICSCTGSKQTQAQNNDFPGDPADSLVASIYRTPCFGVCPYYRQTFYRSGYVLYEGFANVTKKGRYYTYISKEKLKSIGEKAEELGYFTLNDLYKNPHLTDFPTVYSEVRFRGKAKKITLYDADPPKNLIEMNNYLDKVVSEDAEWVKHPNQDMKE